MKIPFLKLLMTSPFDSLIEHAEKVKECAWEFQQAIECHVSERCETFEEHRQEVAKLKNEADVIVDKICNTVSTRFVLPVNEFQLLLYVKAQNDIVFAINDSLDWLSQRNEPGIPEVLKKEIFLLVDAVIEPIEELGYMLAEVKAFFRKYFRKKKAYINNIIVGIGQKEQEANRAEDILKTRIFSLNLDPITVFHTVRLSEKIGAAADSAREAGFIMRAITAVK